MDTLKHNFEDCQVDVVLNERLAPLLKYHPSVDNVITFTEEERHNILAYTAKVWRIMHSTRYDMIIDLQSKMNSLLFSLFSGGAQIRSGLDKKYAKLFLTDVQKPCTKDEYIIDHNLRLLAPLAHIKPISYCHEPSLVVKEEEREGFADYMKQCGVDFKRPIMLAGVTAKLNLKTWKKERIVEVLKGVLDSFPQLQIVLNYAPGHEEEGARAIAEELNSGNVFINVNANSIRKLMAMVSCCTFYFGNEGGTRHIAHALGKPTFSVCAPMVHPSNWIPCENEHHKAICVEDFSTQEQLEKLTYEQRYELIRPEIVLEKLKKFIEIHASLTHE